MNKPIYYSFSWNTTAEMLSYSYKEKYSTLANWKEKLKEKELKS